MIPTASSLSGGTLMTEFTPDQVTLVNNAITDAQAARSRTASITLGIEEAGNVTLHLGALGYRVETGLSVVNPHTEIVVRFSW